MAGLEWDPQILLRGCGLEVWEFDHLLADQSPFAPYHVARERSPIMDLANGYDAYLEDRRRTSKKTIKTTLQKQRKIEREVGEIWFDFDARDQDTLHALMGWKSAQYRRTGRSDRFAKPWITKLVVDLFATQTAECAGTLSALYVNERLVAGHFGLRSREVLSCWFPTYDVTFSKYSPGLLLHLEMAAAAAAQGIRYLDLGKGYAEYKETLKSGDLEVAEGWVEQPSSIALARRVQRAPRRHVTNFVLRHPHLRHTARQALEQLARVRSVR